MRESLFQAPAVFPFVECPNCKQLLELGADVCPRCREEITPEYALLSAAVVHFNTQACSVANSVSSLDAYIPLALIGGLAIYALDWFVSGAPTISLAILAWPLLPLAAIIVWFRRFGRFGIGDDEYLRARREMKRSLLFWLAFLLVQVLFITLALVRRSQT